jgi:hypothetical protein
MAGFLNQSRISGRESPTPGRSFRRRLATAPVNNADATPIFSMRYRRPRTPSAYLIYLLKVESRRIDD